MEIIKSWIMTEEYTETISFEEDLIKLFIKEESIILDEDQTLEDVADEYSDDLWEWANRSKDESLKDLCEYEENQESVDGYVHEYRFKKQDNNMSYEYHWVVVYDEDWGAFMVDVETTILNLKDHPGVIYNKTTGKWEFLEEGSALEAEYLRLEEILAYNLTRLDIPKKVGQYADHEQKSNQNINRI